MSGEVFREILGSWREAMHFVGIPEAFELPSREVHTVTDYPYRQHKGVSHETLVRQATMFGKADNNPDYQRFARRP